MFGKVEARYALRCVLFGIAAAVASIQASGYGSGISSDELVNALLVAVSAALSYAGIGAVSKSVEPSIGRKADGPS